MSTLQSIVDTWLELRADDEPRTDRRGYDRGFKLPRPRVADLHVSLHLEYEYRGAKPFGGCRCYVRDEDDEPVNDADDMPVVGYGADLSAALADGVHRLVSGIDHAVSKHEDAYHGSDEAMRATHPREV